MRMTFRTLLGAVAAAALAGSAQADTVDFSDLIAPPDGVRVGPIYSEDGLTFDTNTDEDDMGSLGDELNADPGGATLAHYLFNGVLTVTKTGGGDFFLNAFDLADGFNDGTEGSVDGSIPFSYVDAGGLHESFLFLDDFPGLQTFTLNLTGVTSFSLTNTVPFFQIDNIVYDQAVCTTRGGCVGGGVPEPASWALMIGGFGLAGGALRRRRFQGCSSVA